MKRGTCRLTIFFAAISLLVIAGCKRPGVNEGVLVYDITYLEEEKASKPVIGLLPTEMRQIFKDNSSKSMIEGFMGMFLTAYISNASEKKNSLIFKVMADKHYCQSNYGEPSLGFDPVDDMKIVPTDEAVTVLGLKAKKAKVYSSDSSFNDFEILYTNDINIVNPNWNNPYREIDGVLLDFRVKMKGITMYIKVREILKEEVDIAEFVVPEGYKKVSAQELNGIVDEIMNGAE